MLPIVRHVPLLAVQRWLKGQAPLLCALTICTLFLCAAQVSSKQPSPEVEPHSAPDEFALKNPNAFDPARRRTVRAMTLPRESAAHLARGIDAAEAQVEPAAADDEASDIGRVSLNSR